VVPCRASNVGDDGWVPIQRKAFRRDAIQRNH
jgi:hypothetical protein